MSYFKEALAQLHDNIMDKGMQGGRAGNHSCDLITGKGRV